jgi:hypothetical protein
MHARLRRQDPPTPGRIAPRRYRVNAFSCRRRRRKPIGLLSPEKQKLSEKQTKVRYRYSLNVQK